MLARREFTVVDEHGNIVTDAQVEVRSEIAGQPLVSIYSDREGAAPLGNPFNVDSTTAVAAFHVAGGAYRVRAFKTGFERIERYVAIGTAAETDAGLIPTTISTGWAFDDATADADPGSGLFRLNHATPASATAVYIDNENAGANSVTGWLDSLDDSGDSGNRGQLTICDPDQPTEVFRIYRVSGSVVDGTGYRKLTVTHITGAGSFTAGTQYSVTFSARGTDSADDKVSKAGDTMMGQLNLVNGSRFMNTGAANEGGELHLQVPASGSTLSGDDVAVDINQDSFRIFETGGSFRGVALNLAALSGPNVALLHNGNGIAQGKHTIWVPASAFNLRSSNSPASGKFTASSSAFDYLAFDPGAAEDAFLNIAMPKNWDEGNISVQFYWMHPSTTTNFGVVWTAFAKAHSNDDAIDGSSFSGSGNVVDTGGTTSDLYISPESSGFSVTGAAENDLLNIIVRRVATDGSDSLAVDAYLIGIKIFYTVNASTDA
jgi:hypothetical protein